MKNYLMKTVLGIFMMSAAGLTNVQSADATVIMFATKESKGLETAAGIALGTAGAAIFTSWALVDLDNETPYDIANGVAIASIAIGIVLDVKSPNSTYELSSVLKQAFPEIDDAEVISKLSKFMIKTAKSHQMENGLRKFSIPGIYTRSLLSESSLSGAQIDKIVQILE